MAFAEIPISKGVFKTNNTEGLRNSEYAENLINLFLDEAGGNIDRPTLSHHTTLSSTEPIGVYPFGDLFVIVTADRNVHTVDSEGTKNNVTGTALPGDLRPTFTDDGEFVYMAGGDAPIKWKQGTLTAALGGSPPDCSHIIYVDGFLLANRILAAEGNKVVQFTDNGEPETWTATNIFSAVAAPDPLVAMTVSQREIYLVGTRTTEVWQNVGTSPVPFTRTFLWEFGTSAPYSVHARDNAVFMLDQNRRILQIVGRQVNRLSEPIEKDLVTYETVDDCFSGSFLWKGSIHVLFVFPKAKKAWSVDLRNNQWSEWRGHDENGWARLKLNCLAFLESKNIICGGDLDTGDIWRFSDTDKTDAEGIFRRARTFSMRDAGGAVRKRADLIRFKMQRDVASAFTGTTPETNPQFELRWKDENRPWSEFRRVSLGQIGETKGYVEFRRLGIYRERKYEFQMSDPAALSISNPVETDETVLTS